LGYPWIRSAAIGAALFAALVVLLVLYASSLYISDDAYITMRYAYNAVVHGALTWNPGFELVDGYTSTLHVLLLAAMFKAGVPLLTADSLMNLFFLAGIIALVAVTGRRALAVKPAAIAISILLLGLSTTYQRYVTAGFETMLFSFLFVGMVAGIYWMGASPRPRWLVALCMFLLAVTRPEGLLLLPVAAGLFVLQIRNTTHSVKQAILPLVLCAVVPTAVFLLVKTRYYGYPVPNTYFAKLTTSRAGKMLNGLEYLWIFVRDNGGVLLAALPFVWWNPGRVAGTRPAVALCVSLVGIVIAAGGDNHAYSRFFAPILPVLILWCTWLLFRGPTWVRVLSACLVAAFVLTQTMFESPSQLFGPGPKVRWTISDKLQKGTENLRTRRWPVLDRDSLAKADLRFLAETFPKDSTYAHEDVGFVGLMLDRTLYDIYGLNDREIAHSPSLDTRRQKVWGKHRIDLVYNRGPDVFFIPGRGPQPTPAPPARDWPEASYVRRIMKQVPGIGLEYEVLNLELPYGRYWPLLVRSDLDYAKVRTPATELMASIGKQGGAIYLTPGLTTNTLLIKKLSASEIVTSSTGSAEFLIAVNGSKELGKLGKDWEMVSQMKIPSQLVLFRRSPSK